jgi:uncharacterized protein
VTEYLVPGVYVEEVPFRSRSIEGIETSTAGFVGPTRAGTTDRASDVLCSLAEFDREYGSGHALAFADGTTIPNYMWHAARAFFENGGQRLHVARASRENAARPSAKDYIAALEHLERVPGIAIVAAPGSTFAYARGYRQHADAIMRALLVHAERVRPRFALIDSADGQPSSEVRTLRAAFDSSYGALYYPWVRVDDPVLGSHLYLPPSGFVAGIYARVAAAAGVHKVPANELVRLATGLERDLSSETDALSSEGINCLRTVPGDAIVVWGARTLSSTQEWKYVNVRRYLLFLETSIDRGTQWALFEPNGLSLWSAVRHTIEDFLVQQWKSGALVGVKPEEAFFVKCDHTTMTQSDIDSGRLICLVGVAPVRPAEFVIFRIGQWTTDRKP